MSIQSRSSMPASSSLFGPLRISFQPPQAPHSPSTGDHRAVHQPPSEKMGEATLHSVKVRRPGQRKRNSVVPYGFSRR